jgi:hypothetical protein
MRYDHPSEAGRLKKLDSIAIWNKAKIVVAISMAIWATDISLLVYGNYLLQIMGKSLNTW